MEKETVKSPAGVGESGGVRVWGRGGCQSVWERQSSCRAVSIKCRSMISQNFKFLTNTQIIHFTLRLNLHLDCKNIWRTDKCIKNCDMVFQVYRIVCILSQEVVAYNWIFKKILKVRYIYRSWAEHTKGTQGDLIPTGGIPLVQWPVMRLSQSLLLFTVQSCQPISSHLTQQHRVLAAAPLPAFISLPAPPQPPSVFRSHQINFIALCPSTGNCGSTLEMLSGKSVKSNKHLHKSILILYRTMRQTEISYHSVKYFTV